MIITPSSIFFLQKRKCNTPSQNQWREFDFLLRGCRQGFIKLLKNILTVSRGDDSLCNRDLPGCSNKNSSHHHNALLTKGICFTNVMFSNPGSNLKCQALLPHFIDKALGAQKADVLNDAICQSGCSRGCTPRPWLPHCIFCSHKTSLTKITVGFH